MQIEWSYGGKTGIARIESIPPHTEGAIRIPGQKWGTEKMLRVRALEGHNVIDEFELPLGPRTTTSVPAIKAGGRLRMLDTPTGFVVRDEEFAVNFNAGTGLIESVIFRDQLAIHSGPHLNFRAQGKRKKPAAQPIDDLAQNWKLDKLEKKLSAGRAQIKLIGHYDSVHVDFTVDIESGGRIITGYKLYDPPPQPIQELGIRYKLPETYDKVAWQRTAYWDFYPSPHLGMPAGSTSLYGSTSQYYREDPANGWIFDTKDFYFWGMKGTSDGRPLTNLAKAMKANVTTYSLSAMRRLRLTIEGYGEAACRVNNDQNGDLYLHCNNFGITSI